MYYRFRGYFQALMSSMRLLCCEPGRFLFKRSDSKSSLDIGVRPMDGGVVRMELHHYTNPVPARRTRRQPINAAANPTFNVQVGKRHCVFFDFECTRQCTALLHRKFVAKFFDYCWKVCFLSSFRMLKLVF